MKKTNTYVFILLNIALLFFAKDVKGQLIDFAPVGSAGFSAGTASYTSLYVYNGTPYVAYQDAGNSNYATVMKYNGSSWVTVGSAGFSAGSAYYTSLYVYNGTPYVAYRDGGNSNKATVMKYNGSSWVTVGSAGFSAGDASYVSLYVYNGTPYVAYRDGGNSYYATVMKYNGSSWVTVGSAGFSAGDAYYTSLYVYNGTPYVAYEDGGNSYYATVMKYNGSSWVTVGSAGFSAGGAYYSSLYVYNGTPYVAYRDGGNSNYATVMKYNGSSWVTVGSAGFSAVDAPFTSLYVYNGTPYVAYKDGGNSYYATVMKYNGSSWVTVGSAGFSAGDASYASLYVYNGTPYLAYEDGGNSSKATVAAYDTLIASGSGTSGDPYLISTADELSNVRDALTSYFKQTADIDLNVSPYNTGSGWDPIGTNGSGSWFEGYYDGNGHSISNLFIDRSSTNFVGLFGSIFNGQVHDLGLKNVNVTGKDYTGAVVGLNYSDVIRCFSTGTVNGNSYVGGLVGSNESYNGSTSEVTNCYTTATVNSADYGGGLMGRFTSGTVTNSYSVGSVSATNSDGGGFVGYYSSGTITNSFWNSDSAGTTGYGYGSATGATAETSDSLKTNSTFTDRAWDFTNTWSISGSTNNGYPYLQAVTPLPVELSSFSAKVNGDKVELNWETATEVNNHGFEIQRSMVSNQQSADSWAKIGFVAGAGNTNSPKSYSFTDQPTGGTSFSYRIKQIDNDGKYKNYDAITVTLDSKTRAKLIGNYPNPFNPSTQIKFYLPETENVTIKIYDILGKVVRTLVNKQTDAGYHIVYWNGLDQFGNGAASGVYIYRLQAIPSAGSGQTFIQTKKMALLK